MKEYLKIKAEFEIHADKYGELLNFFQENSKKSKVSIVNRRGINKKDNLPTEQGIYLAKGVYGDKEPREIEVYKHPIKGLSCFAEDFGSAETGVDDSTDCYVSVQNTGLEFIIKLRDLD